MMMMIGYARGSREEVLEGKKTVEVQGAPSQQCNTTTVAGPTSTSYLCISVVWPAPWEMVMFWYVLNIKKEKKKKRMIMRQTR